MYSIIEEQAANAAKDESGDTSMVADFDEVRGIW